MMVIGLYILFAVIVGGLGIYLLMHQQGFLGISAQQAKHPARWFGWLFTIDAVYY